MKGQVFETMQRVMMDECAHRPILRDDFPGKPDDAAKFHAAGIGIVFSCYLVHACGLSAVRYSRFASVPRKSCGMRPKAINRVSTMVREANSERRKSAGLC